MRYKLEQAFKDVLQSVLNPLLKRVGLESINIGDEVEYYLNNNDQEYPDIHDHDCINSSRISSSIQSVIQKKLQDKENELLHKLEIDLTISFDVPDLLNKLQAQEDSYVKEKLIAQLELYKVMIEKGCYISFVDVWKFVIDGKNHAMGAYAFEDEGGYIVAALKAFTFAINYKKKRDCDYVEELHSTAIDKVYKYEMPSNNFNITHDCVTFSLDANNAPNIQKNFDKYSIDMAREKGFKKAISEYVLPIDEDDFSEIRNNPDQALASFTRVRAFPSCTTTPPLVPCKKVKITSYPTNDNENKTYLNQLRKVYNALLLKSTKDIDRLLSCIYLFRELTIAHVFSDRNLITSLINFNVELGRNGFPYVNFENPNLHDFHKPNKFAAVVIQSMYGIEDSHKEALLQQLNQLYDENLSWQGWKNIMTKRDTAMQQYDQYHETFFSSPNELNDLTAGAVISPVMPPQYHQ